MTQTNIHLEPASTASARDLDEVAGLLREVFDAHRDWNADLAWQYIENPCGPARYVNARAEDGKLVGHYAVIPAPPFRDPQFRHIRPFVSLNTAVHPSAQGKGIFKATANALYSALRSEAPSVVVGVANANSVNGFLRSLGFTGLGELSLRVYLPWQTPTADVPRLLDVDAPFLKWRANRPGCDYRVAPKQGALVRFMRRGGIPVEALLSTHLSAGLLESLPVPRRAFWRSVFGPLRLYANSSEGRGGITVPKRLRPSPLHMICRVLADDGSDALVEHVRGRLFEFVDFDVV
jgi:hypothetical protein